MLTLLIYCLVLFALAYLFINKFISIAPRLSLIDVPNERSSHKKITPRGAGLVFPNNSIRFKIESPKWL